MVNLVEVIFTIFVCCIIFGLLIYFLYILCDFITKSHHWIKQANFLGKTLFYVVGFLLICTIFIWYFCGTQSIVSYILTKEKVDRDTVSYVLIYPNRFPPEDEIKLELLNGKNRERYKIYKTERYKIVDKKIIGELIQGIHKSARLPVIWPINLKGTNEGKIYFCLTNGKVVGIYIFGFPEGKIRYISAPRPYYFHKPSKLLKNVYREIIKNGIGKIEKEKNERKK
jgi:hypothetical protein